MKTPRNKTQGLYLKKSNDRWKWMAGATAATAAGVTASQAGTITTINLSNNYISFPGGNHLNPDLAQPGHPDLALVGGSSVFYKRQSTSHGKTFITATLPSVRASINGVGAKAFFSGGSGGFQLGYEILGSQFRGVGSGTGFFPLTGSIPITFSGNRFINGGALTPASLEVTVTATRGPFVEIQLDSFTYNKTAASLPDQGSTLALLAIGAGGILALRRRRAA